MNGPMRRMARLVFLGFGLQLGALTWFQVLGADGYRSDPRNVRTAIKLGLPEETALRALTIVPARILGLDRQVGSLEPGKIANVILTKGPLFDEKTQVDKVFVDGAAWKF